MCPSKYFSSLDHFSGPPTFLNPTLKRSVIGRLLDQCSEQEFSHPLAFKKVQSRQKQLCILKRIFSQGKDFDHKAVFTGFDIIKSHLWVDITFFMSHPPYKRPFYLSLLKQNLENKQLILAGIYFKPPSLLCLQLYILKEGQKLFGFCRLYSLIQQN